MSQITNAEKIQLLKKEPPKHCCLVDYYQNMLETMGDLKTDYGDYMTTAPMDTREEVKRLPSADYDLCCALLTMLFREDHFSGYGCFDRKVEDGTVQSIINRMIYLLERRGA